MKKNIFTWLFILGLTAIAFAGQSNGSSGLNPINIDSLLKKIELIPVLKNGDKDNRINIVIMNRWSSRDKDPYNSPKMKEEFLKDINESLIAALTPGDPRAQTAFVNYRAFFNVYALWWPDMPEWGKGVDQRTIDALRDRLFLPWKDEYTGWVTFLVMPNSNSGGGGAGRDLERRFGSALIAGNGIGKMLHEISHTCMSIGDEYTTAATGTSALPIYNASTEYRRDHIKWRKWIELTTPVPTPYSKEYAGKVGAFEGCQYHLTDYFRSSAQGCIMGAGVFDNTEEMCPICNQRVAMRVNKLVNPIGSFTPSNRGIAINGKASLHFEIDPITPIPNTQVVRWILNGKTIATGVNKVDVKLGAISAYELTCSLTDGTPFIRPDPPYGQFPRSEITWSISNSAPTSRAAELQTELIVPLEGDPSSEGHVIKSKVTGGKPPYFFSWSTGSTDKDLENIGPGIYDLVVTDSEYRMAKAHQALYAGTPLSAAPGDGPSLPGNLQLEAEVTASENDRDNGQIALKITGGNEPYTILWNDGTPAYAEGKIYEAENGFLDIAGTIIKDYFGAGNNRFVDFKGGEGSASWTVEVAKEGIYPVDIIYGSVVKDKSQLYLSVNGGAKKQLVLRGTLPMLIGWEKVSANSYLKEGLNRVTLHSDGYSLPNIDYLRVPPSFTTSAIQAKERINLPPGDYSVTVKDKNNRAVPKTFSIPDLYPFRVAALSIEKKDPKTLRITDPLAGYSYQWYSEDAPLFQQESFEKPLAVGTEFSPAEPGNYYVAAKNNLTHGLSLNRINLAIGQTPKKGGVKPMNPSNIDEDAVKLWFDASDLDGDEETDGVVPRRGPHDWKEKTWRNPGKIFVKYEPNKLNGYGIGSFDHVWVGGLGKEVTDYQTIMMVYKENSISMAGTAPFKTLGKFMGKSAEPQKRLFDPAMVDTKIKEGKTYLNGKQVDPFNTPNPMKFCILTLELSAPAKDPINSTDGNWEGSLAEVLVFNKKLSDAERQGIEEYLRKKWFSSIDLDL